MCLVGEGARNARLLGKGKGRARLESLRISVRISKIIGLASVACRGGSRYGIAGPPRPRYVKCMHFGDNNIWRIPNDSVGGVKDMRMARSPLLKLRLRGPQEKALRQVFQRIAMPFSPQKTQNIRTAELSDLLKECRLRQGREQGSSRLASSRRRPAP